MPAVNSVNSTTKKTGRSLTGCAAKSTAFAVIALCAGVYLMGRWETVNGAERAAAVLLVLIGGVFLIPLILTVGVKLATVYFRKKITEPIAGTLAAGERMVAQNKAIYAEHYDYRPATDADFVDRAWYDAATQELAGLGFVALGDVVNASFEEASGVVVVLRRFLSADRTTMAALYQYVARNKDLRVCDMESELSNGTFVTSSTAESAAAITMPPQIRDKKHPATTPLPELFRLHEESKAAALQDMADASFLQFNNMDDYNASQTRQQVIKAAFRKGIGYIDPEEVRRIAEQKFPGDAATAAIATVSADIARRQERAKNEPEPPASGA